MNVRALTRQVNISEIGGKNQLAAIWYNSSMDEAELAPTTEPKLFSKVALAILIILQFYLFVSVVTTVYSLVVSGAGDMTTIIAANLVNVVLIIAGVWGDYLIIKTYRNYDRRLARRGAILVLLPLAAFVVYVFLFCWAILYAILTGSGL